MDEVVSIYIAVSRKVVGGQCQMVIWDMINTQFVTTEAVQPTVVAFL